MGQPAGNYIAKERELNYEKGRIGMECLTKMDYLFKAVKKKNHKSYQGDEGQRGCRTSRYIQPQNNKKNKDNSGAKKKSKIENKH